MKIAIQQSELDTSSNTFADKLQQEFQRLDGHDEDRPFKCDKCSHTFKYQWILNAHQKICSRDKKKHIKFKYDGCYTCLICGDESNNIEKFKLHLFTTHTDIEAQAKYEKSIESLIGDSFMKKLREPVFKKITEGSLDKYIIKLLGKCEKTTVLPTKSHYRLFMEPEDGMTDLRISAYD